MRRMHFPSSAEGWTYLLPDEISPETFLGDDLSKWMRLLQIIQSSTNYCANKPHNLMLRGQPHEKIQGACKAYLG